MTYPDPHFPAPTMIDVNGVTLETFVLEPTGPANGKAAILSHGWPEHAYSWRHQMPMLAQLGYHVIAPNQRGYGNSSRPEAVTDYDIDHLTGDLAALLDHFGYDDALFVGHDWGAIIVWNMALLHPKRVRALINLSVPFMERGTEEWVGFWEQHLGGDFYIVHFNRQPGVADAAFAADCRQFLRNMYRTNQWQHAPVELGAGMAMINIAKRDSMPGDPIMSDADLEVFASAFDSAGFTGGINWYRNFSRNWLRLADVPQVVAQPALMIHGQYDMVPASEKITEFVPNVEVTTLPCGHWIQQELPEQTNHCMEQWLAKHDQG
ncbi:MAG: alpha/beta fold hydrolase [Pseudomonadales bacterium]